MQVLGMTGLGKIKVGNTCQHSKCFWNCSGSRNAKISEQKCCQPLSCPQRGRGTHLWQHGYGWCHSRRRRRHGPGRSGVPPGPGGWYTRIPEQAPPASRLSLHREDRGEEAEPEGVGGTGSLHTPQPSGLRPMPEATRPNSRAWYLLRQGNHGPPGARRGLPGSASAQLRRPWACEARPMRWFQHLVTAGWLSWAQVGRLGIKWGLDFPPSG